MKKTITFILSMICAFSFCACSDGNNSSESGGIQKNDQENQIETPIKNEETGENGENSTSQTERVRIYYDVVRSDAIVDDDVMFDEERKLYYFEWNKGCSDYTLLSVKSKEYILAGWNRADGTRFVGGTVLNEDVFLKAVWIGKNESPLV